MECYLFVRVLLLGLLPILLCSAADQEIYRDKYVVAYTERRSPLLGNVHGDETTIVKTLGRTYRNVRGSKPYYIQVPELNSILFVTEDGEEDARLHLVNLETKKETMVRLDGSHFGSSIGYEQLGRKRGDAFTDYVEKVNGGVFELHSVASRWTEIVTVNVVSASVERRKTIYRDKDGRVTRRFIDGKRVQ